MMAGLSACSRDRTGDVAVLEEEVCRLTEVTASSRAQLSLLRAEANRLDAAVFDLTSTKADLEDEVYSIQTTIREVRQDWATLAKSGVEKDSFVVGARLSSLGVGYKVYRDVIVKQVTAHDVLISHADGIARLKKHELLDMDEPPLELKPLNLATYVPPTPASMALKVTPPQYAARGRESQAAPSRSSRVVPMPFNNRSSQKQKPRPKTVEILSWWGRGSPYGVRLTDSFGTVFEATPPKRSQSTPSCAGPWLASYGHSSMGRSSRNVRSGTGLSGYKPIGWNYLGTSLDRIYGSRR